MLPKTRTSGQQTLPSKSIVGAHVRSSGNRFAPRASRLAFIRLSYVVDEWGTLVAVVAGVTSTSSRDAMGDGTSSDEPWGPLIDGYRTGVDPAAALPTGAPTPPNHGDFGLGGYTHVVDGAGQSRPIPEVDNEQWSSGDAFNFWLFGKVLPTTLAAEVIGLAASSALVEGGAIGVASAHRWGRGIAVGVHAVVEGLNHAVGHGPGSHKGPDVQSGSQAGAGQGGATPREAQRPEKPDEEERDPPPADDGPKPDEPKPDDSTTWVYIDVDSGAYTSVTTTPPPKDEKPGDDGSDEDASRERLVQAQKWAEAVGAVSFVGIDPVNDESPREQGVIVVGKWAGLIGPVSGGDEPMPDEGSIADRLAEVEKWLGELGAGTSDNGSDGWWYVPGRGGWVMRG